MVSNYQMLKNSTHFKSINTNLTYKFECIYLPFLELNLKSKEKKLIFDKY